jgi:hypothetical protein
LPNRPTEIKPEIGKNATGGKFPRLFVVCVLILRTSADIAFARNGFDYMIRFSRLLPRIAYKLVDAGLKGLNVLFKCVKFFDEILKIEFDSVRFPPTHRFPF